MDGENLAPQPKAAETTVAQKPARAAAKVSSAEKKPTPAQEIRKSVTDTFNKQKDAANQLQARLNLSEQRGKTPSEIIAQMPTWLDIQDTRDFVQGGMDLYTDVQARMGSILKKNPNLTQEEAQTLAENQVLESRVSRELKAAAARRREAKQTTGEPAKTATSPAEAATPQSEQQPSSEDAALSGAEVPKTEEQIKADEKKVADDAENARLKEVVGIAKAWVDAGASPDAARAALGEVAAINVVVAQKAVNTEQAQMEDIRARAETAKTPGEQERAQKEYDQAEKVMKRAQEDLDRQMKHLREVQLGKTKDATPEDQLVAYDFDLAITSAQLSNVEETINELNDRLTISVGKPQEIARIQARLRQVEAQKKIMTKKVEDLTKEREAVGTEDQRKINRAVGMVVKLVGAPTEPDATLDGDKKIAAQKKYDAEIAELAKNPLKYLQDRIDTPQKLADALTHSDISAEDQKKLLEVAKAEAAEKAVKKKDILDTATGAGRTGILALLLLLYTAYGSNKKAKGGQMG